ncbi:MAG: hypothetical protein ABIJ96_02550 [Elusimicrobiota bacterium]
MANKAKNGSRMTPRESRIAARCRTPYLVQRWLKSIPYNRETGGETIRTFRGVVRSGSAHCLEGALCAAAILERHGYPPLLLDLESQDNLDHVLFLFRGPDGWGTVAKSRDPGLFGRRPVFRSVRDLVRSYFDPYVDMTGRITGYGTLDLRTVGRVDWRLSAGNVWAIQKVLIKMPHRRLRSTDVRYQYWHERYRRYRRLYPGRKPVYYPGRGNWL